MHPEVVEVAIEPKTKADQEKMGLALARLAAEDPSFRVTTDHESGQTIIKGMGELHLEILVDEAGVLVLDSNGSVIQRVGRFGNYDGQFVDPHWLAVDSRENIYVADFTGRRVQKFVRK